MAVQTDSRLVAFLYELLYSEILPSRVDEIMASLPSEITIDLASEHVATMANDLAEDLLSSN